MMTRLLVACGLAVGFAVTLLHSNADATPAECEIAVAWAESNLESLPRTYLEFSAYESVVWRKAIYSQLAGAERISLWEEHMSTVMADPGLSEEQRLFLADVRGRVGDLLVAGSDEDLVALGKRAKEVLGADIARWALSDLGAATASTAAAASEACSCSQQSDWCPSAYECGTDGDGCDVIRDDCGTLWQFDCDGECLLIGPA
jgi:hypothetical protein